MVLKEEDREVMEKGRIIGALSSVDAGHKLDVSSQLPQWYKLRRRCWLPTRPGLVM